MGTSASSKGPGGGVPMVPPWVPPPSPSQPDGSNGPIDGGGGNDGSSPADSNQTPSQPVPAQASPTAPSGRFRGARRNLGSFASGGDKRDMRRGVRDYVRTGYGGKGTAVRRFSGTVSTASALGGALSSLSGGQPATGDSLDPALLVGRSAREVIDAVVEAVRPSDGTQDAEASRTAIKDAMSEVLTVFPDADLFNLSPEQREVVIENFVALDIYQRMALDIGRTIQERAPTATVGVARLKEVRDYIKQTVAASFRNLRTSGNTINSGKISQVVHAALEETFQVFEAYTK